MRHFKQLTLVMLAIWILIAAPLNAQTRPSVEFSGLTYTALGRAALKVLEDHLVISNIGPGGLEGAFVNLVTAEGLHTEWQDFSEEAVPATLLQIITFGVIQNRSSHEIVSSLFIAPIERDLPFPTLAIEANFGPLAANNYTFEVYNNGELTGTQTAELLFIVATPTIGSFERWPTALTQYRNGRSATSYTLKWNSALNFIFPNRDSLQIFGDELRIFSENALSVDFLTGVEFRMGGISPFTITHTEATPPNN